MGYHGSLVRYLAASPVHPVVCRRNLHCGERRESRYVVAAIAECRGTSRYFATITWDISRNSWHAADFNRIRVHGVP